MAASDVLVGLGFKADDIAKWQQLSDDLGLSEGYPHKVLAAYTKDGVTALIEQNVSEDNSGGVAVIMKHPAVLILESSHGRVCVPNHDEPDNASLIEAVAGDLAYGD